MSYNKTAIKLLQRAVRRRLPMGGHGYLFSYDMQPNRSYFYRVTADTNWSGEEVWINDLKITFNHIDDPAYSLEQGMSKAFVFKGPKRIKRAIKEYMKRIKRHEKEMASS